MAATDQPSPVGLVDAGVPADQGLSSLGVLMQLAGHLLAAFAVFVFTIALVAQGSRGAITLWLFAIFASSCMRSMFQLAAGKQLVFGEPGQVGRRFAGIERYITVAVVQSIAVTIILVIPLHTHAMYAIAIGAGLLVWPLALRTVIRLPRFARFDADLPVTEDKGFEGASILMLVLGLTGAVAMSIILWILFQLPGNQLQSGPNILVVLAILMLLVRSLLHAHAGLSGLRTTSLDRSVEAANRYANFGVISSFCAGGAMLLFAMASGMQVIGLAVVCGLVWVLVAWPMIVRRLFADRQFADLLAGGAAPVHRRAPDAGLTWLGWMLFALAAWNASFVIPSFIANIGSSRFEEAVFALGGAVGLHSVWFSAGLAVLQGWAGYELVRMSPQSKAIATVYGVVATGLTLWLDWPAIEMFRQLFAGGIHIAELRAGVMLELPAVAAALIVPIATIVLVHRKIAPAARARYRDKS